MHPSDQSHAFAGALEAGERRSPRRSWPSAPPSGWNGRGPEMGIDMVFGLFTLKAMKEAGLQIMRAGRVVGDAAGETGEK